MSTAKYYNDTKSISRFDVMHLIIIGFTMVVLVSVTSCYDSSTEDARPLVDATSKVQDSQASEGQALYEANCAMCHSADGSSINGKSPEAITAAMTDIGSMTGMSLTAAEVQSISDFLTGNTGGDTGGSGTSGQAIYEANCAGCHGADGSTLNGRSGAQIAAAIVNVNTMTGISLSGTEIQAIATFLGGGTSTGGPPASHINSEDGVMHAPGNDLPYTNNCTMCHGVTLDGGVGPSCKDCHWEVWNESAPTGGGDSGGNGSSEGQSLYTDHCAACHGITGSSLTGRTVDQISTAISGVGTMNNIALSLTELQAIADYLAGGTGGDTGGGGNTGGGSGTADGQALYTSNCAGCHGVDGASINDKSAGGITAAITGISSMTGITLSATEIQAISDFLTGGTGGGSGGGDTGGGSSSGPPASHTNNEEGVLHADGNNYPYSNGCTTCHGATLEGGFGSSCFACHGVEWNENPPTGGGDTGNGSGTVDGQALYTSNCAGCHGADGASINDQSANGISAAIINIGSMTSITLSATEIQAISDFLTGNTGGGTGGGGDTSGPPATHTNNEDGIPHAPGNNYPYTNGCTTCHGATLEGGTGPSCFACHGEEWNENAPSGDTGSGGSSGGSTTDGQALYTTYCGACHGATGSNINGRTATAISAAINNIGSMNSISLTSAEVQAIADYLSVSTGGGGSGGDTGVGLPANHTDSEESVLHAPGNNYPYANGCTSCHGSNLQGGVGPSCYSCHGQEWRDSGSGGSDSGDSGGSEEEDD